VVICPNRDDRGDAEIDSARIDQGDASGDDARSLQVLDTPPAWCCCKPDRLCDDAGGQRGVRLNELEDISVDDIHVRKE